MTSAPSASAPRADAVARGVSLLLIPPTMSTAAFTLLVLAYQHGSIAQRTGVWAVAVLCSGLLQIADVLRLRNARKVSAYDVPLRRQRTRPYLASAAISGAGVVVLCALGASVHIWSLMWCYAANTLLLAAVNSVWKISAHLMGFMGPVTALLPLLGPSLLALMPLAIALGWARIRLKAHTPSQVLGGAIAGVVLTSAQLFIISTYASG